MAFITWKNIKKQLHYDLVGKDSYRGVTLTYSWLANQFGHFGLCFIPASVLVIVLRHYGVNNPGPIGAFSVWGIWVAFETYNCIEPILFSHKASSIFPAPWSNIVYDVLTDLAFFGLGAFAAGYLLSHSMLLLICFGVLVMLVAYPALDWYKTKMYQQGASYPFQFRLNQWATTCSEENKTMVLNFIRQNDTGGKHLFVFGAYKSGKTSLSVAIANECSIRHHACKYVTAMKLFSLFFEQDEKALWDWRESSLLVIDDINPGFIVQEELITPDAFLRFLDHDGMADANKKVIREKNIIWVLGMGDGTKAERQNRWKQMLVGLGVSAGNIYDIEL